MKIDTIFANDVQLLLEDERASYEAIASITLNPNITWIKFILLDDLPNGNKQRVPITEFNNVIKTGVHMPIKVAMGEIEEGHTNAGALGTITHLFKDKNTVKGLAALWGKERPDDVEMLKKKYEDGEPLNLSWELSYKEGQINDDIEDLIGISMNAATFVGMPAYAGRTPVIAMASNGVHKEEEDVPEDIETQASEEEVVEEVVETSQEEPEVVEVVEEETSEETPAEETDEVETSVAELKQTIEDLKAELEELRQFKANVEKSEKEAEKFASIKTKFQEAGLELEDDYFDERKAKLLEMNDDMIDFMVQEMVAFSSKNSSASLEYTPGFIVSDDENVDPRELGKLLRNK